MVKFTLFVENNKQYFIFIKLTKFTSIFFGDFYTNGSQDTLDALSLEQYVCS